jgi:hypothetical protein
MTHGMDDSISKRHVAVWEHMQCQIELKLHRSADLGLRHNFLVVDWLKGFMVEVHGRADGGGRVDGGGSSTDM